MATMTNFTQEQQEAVEEREGQLLVAAAAGSGKTKVLVERLFTQMVGKENRNIKEFLVITFTRDAAGELKHRISQRLKEEIEILQGQPVNPVIVTEIFHLQQQIALIPKANVSTIHGLCGNLVREHGHTLGINPSFRQLEEDEAVVLGREVMESTLAHWYNEAQQGRGTGFLEMVDFFTGERTDEKLVSILTHVHKNVQSEANPKEWLLEQKNMWDFAKIPLFPQLPWGKVYLEFLRAEVMSAREEIQIMDQVYGTILKNSFGKVFSALLDWLGKLQDLAETALNSGTLQDWDLLCDGFEFKEPRKGTDRSLSDDLKEIEEKVNNRRKALYKKVILQKPQKSADVVGDLQKISPHISVLVDVILSFSEQFIKEKRRRNMLDFGDLEHIAVELLVDAQGKQTPLAKALSTQFVEIMVDEYQDTNKVQNTIFSALAMKTATGEDKNLFFVGDVKQSIYSFRLADPSIFMNHYENFSHKKGEYPRAMLLSNNFRSRKEVLDGCNDFFREVMTPEFGGTNYEKDGMLVCGGTFPDYAPPNSTPRDRENCCPYHVDLDVICGKGYDTTLTTGGKHHIEAYWVAKRVRELMDSKFQVTDESGQGFRDVKYSDILVLLRSYKSSVAFYEEAMEEQEIPFKAPDNGDIFQNTEVEVAFSFLKIIDNPLQDIPLVSVLRSPLFGFTPDDLALLKQGSGTYFYDKMCHLSLDSFCMVEKEEDGHFERCSHEPCEEIRRDILPALLEKRDHFLGLLKKFREAAWEKSTTELQWFIMEETNMMGIFGCMTDGEERQARLMEFYRILGTVTGDGNTLFSTIYQLEALMALEKTPQASLPRGDDDVVELKSIHTAKGLEKPVVIVAGLGREYQLKSVEETMLVQSDLGLGPMLWQGASRSFHGTEPRDVIKKLMRRNLVSEELRLLYVAMTRAKDKLIMTVSLKDSEKTLSSLAPKTSKPLMTNVLEEQVNMGDVVLLYALTRPESPVLWNHVLKWTSSDVPEAPNWKPKFQSRWNISWISAVTEIDSLEDKILARKQLSLLKNSQNFTPTPEQIAQQQKMASLRVYCEERYDWEYPYRKEEVIPSKFTATQIKGRALVAGVQQGAEIQPVVVSDDFYQQFLVDLLEMMEEKEGKPPQITFPQLEEEMREAEEHWLGGIPTGKGASGVVYPQERTLAELKAMDREPSFVKIRTQKMTPTERGNAIHLVMQYLDLPTLQQCSIEVLEERLEQLVKENKITKEQRNVVQEEKIMAFLRSPWGEAACHSPVCHQEFKFSMLVAGSKFHYETEEPMLLQGVVDCWYEDEQGNLVVIDFKSDRVPMTIPGILDKKAKDHEKQMEVYALALEEVTGKKVLTKVLWFFEGNCGVEVMGSTFQA